MTTAARICPVCNGTILRRSPQALYCSSTCKDARNNGLKAARKAGATPSSQSARPAL